MTELVFPKAGQVTVKRDGTYIIVEMSVKAIPWDAALEVAKAITIKAREIEADIKAGRIIDDQALLIRLGIPLGLTNKPELLKAAKNESVYSPELRRYITGAKVKGIESAERLGTPKLIQHKPKQEGNDGQ